MKKNTRNNLKMEQINKNCRQQRLLGIATTSLLFKSIGFSYGY